MHCFRKQTDVIKKAIVDLVDARPKYRLNNIKAEAHMKMTHAGK